ncbi:MAG: hypothetical protein KAJ19_26075 [Gammaproteobacteria bacterium]|nr:hypothetical protein [Gammaproteobacteria bacterium]
MSKHISDGQVKTLKSHECRVCGETIPAGVQCHRYTGIDDDIGFFSVWFHHECWEYSIHWDETEWENCIPGAVSRAEIAAEAP